MSWSTPKWSNKYNCYIIEKTAYKTGKSRAPYTIRYKLTHIKFNRRG